MSAAGLPLFGIRELQLESCDRVRHWQASPTAVRYEVARTPNVTAITPARGSSAGGTHVLIQVSGLDPVLQPALSVARTFEGHKAAHRSTLTVGLQERFGPT